MSAPDSLDADTLRRIRAALPSAAFQPDPGKLLRLGAYAAIFALAHLALALVGLSAWLALLIPVAAVALSGVGCHAHELAHGSILRAGPVRRAAELLFWGLLLVPPTIWRRLHSESHPLNHNTSAEPERRFLASEGRASARWYERLQSHRGEMFPWSPLVVVHLACYFSRNASAVLLPVRLTHAVELNRPAYRGPDALVIVGELVALAALHYGLFLLTGGELWPYIVMAIGTQALTSCIAMAYVVTHHGLNPPGHEADPIRGTTSVIVPAWLDRLHANFSYHTEHHVFPAMNSDYYPALSRVLAKTFPETYTRIPIRAAWRRLRRNSPFVELGTDPQGSIGGPPASGTTFEAPSLKEAPVAGR